MLKFE
jgi:glucosamine-6-phosphate deaminase